MHGTTTHFQYHVFFLHIKVKVAYHDGTPVIDNVNKLLISYGPNWDEKNYTSEQYSLDSNGLATVTLTLPDDISGVSMNVSYTRKEIKNQNN